MEDRLVWLDMEMTGLDPERDRIIEVAAVLTGSHLAAIDEFSHVVKTPMGVLASMNEWCQKTHGANGLAKEAARSTVRLGEVEEMLIDWLVMHGFKPKTAVLAGNTVHFDRRFIARWMPDLHEFLHFRLVDVTSMREFVLRALPEGHHIRDRVSDLSNPDRDSDTHRALDDCHGAILEAEIYWSFLSEASRFQAGA